VEFLLKYLNEVQAYKNTLILKSINEYLTSRVNLIIIVFSVFAIILVISLICTLIVIIDILKKKSFENKILVKIIPFEEITLIQAADQERKLKKKDKKKNTYKDDN